jgi:hypothetical protein
MPGDSIPKASDNDGAWGFTKKDAARIGRVVKRVEAQYFNAPAPRAKYPVGAAGSSLIPITVITNVTAGSEATPSSFSCKVMVPSGSSHGWTSSGQPTVTGYNRAAGVSFSASGGSPKSAWATGAQGVLYLVAADC